MIPRVIPTLLLRRGGLVKGVRFENHSYVGDPVNAVRIFNEKEVDELVFLDISATSEGRGPDFALIGDIASQAFMPLAYGGGLSTLQDVERLYKIGIEKAILNTAASCDVAIVRGASQIAGAQSVVVSMDVKKNMWGKYEVYTRAGRDNTKCDPVEYAKMAEDAGAGEILLCSMDREGTCEGYDCRLVERVSAAVSIPLIAAGGAGSLGDIAKVIDHGASAAAAGTMFVYHGRHKAVLITYPEYENIVDCFKGGAE